MAHPAAGNVIDNDSIAGFEPPTPGSRPLYLAARFVAGYHPLVAFRTRADMLMVYRPNVTAADCR